MCIRYLSLIVAVPLALGAPAHGVEIKVLSTYALKTVLDDLGPKFEQSSGHKLAITFGTAAQLKAQIEKGSVVARLQIDEKGNVTEVTIVSADPPRVFDRAVIDALKDWKFSAEGEKYIAEIEIGFKLQ